MSITKHDLWPTVKPYIVIDEYDRDGSARNPRIRIEMRSAPPDVVQAALALTSPCVSCGSMIHPFRTRQKAGPGGRTSNGGTVYYAATCPLDVRIGCSRSHAARDEYIAVKGEVLRGHVPARSMVGAP